MRMKKMIVVGTGVLLLFCIVMQRKQHSISRPLPLSVSSIDAHHVGGDVQFKAEVEAAETRAEKAPLINDAANTKNAMELFKGLESEDEEEGAYWVHLTPEESFPYLQVNCTSPFKHCCLGQCRQGPIKVDVEQMLWKWNEKRKGAMHAAKLTDLLEYMSNRPQKMKKKKNSNPGGSGESCNIIMVGDSLDSDLAMAANCELMRDGYQLTSCDINLSRRTYGTDSDVTCKTNVLPGLSHFVLENPSAESCQKVVIVNFLPSLSAWIGLPMKAALKQVALFYSIIMLYTAMIQIRQAVSSTA
jgi:hypothetical protein